MKYIFIILISIYFNYVYSSNIALPCYGCHMNESDVISSSIPSLENLEKEYFIKAFLQYKNNERDNYLMNIISKGYTIKQINELADYFTKTKKNDH